MKIILKVNDVINCLNKNLTHFVRYFKKEKTNDIGTFSVEHSPYRVINPPFQNHPPITRITLFLKIPPSPTLPANWSSQVFHINKNATVKLSSINTIHVKEHNNVGFFIFKFFLKYMSGIIKYMLGNIHM